MGAETSFKEIFLIVLVYYFSMTNISARMMRSRAVYALDSRDSGPNRDSPYCDQSKLAGFLL